MKKTGLTILLTALTIYAAHGQSAYDAALFSENSYEGTARSVAMGNAFTALGGDLGGVSINPAGSAVANYSQFALTPSITISSCTAQGVSPDGSSNIPYFEKECKTNRTKGGLPNIGFSFNFDTGRKYGLKNVSLGFIANRSNSWCEDIYATGTNFTSSFAAAAASEATDNIAAYNANLPYGEPRYSYRDFESNNVYDYYSPWKDVVGYRSGIFTTYDDAGEKFIASTELLLDNGKVQQGGGLRQNYGRTVFGSKYEYLINIGANISDFIYIGFNLGINSLSYDMSEYFKEKAIDPNDFEIRFENSETGEETYTCFNDMTYRYNYSASGTGVYGKLGIIVTPGYGLRFGAAIQTPTRTTIEEQWIEEGENNYTNSQFSGSESSPLGEYGYSFRSPFRANFGLAYTLGGFAVISADYELADYGGMRYSVDRYEMPDSDVDYFETVNDDIRNAYGVAHQLRIGAEVKPLSQLAVRAGYNLTTPGQKKYYDAETDEYVKFQHGDIQNLHNISFGLGFISKKSFFADLACRYTLATKEYYMPYSDYQFDDEGYIVNYSPEIQIMKSNWKVLMTLGWRF